jgi:MFS transporter, DHA2 family, methylenomycin A resistance protein
VRRIAASVPLAVVLLDVTAVAVLVPDIRLALGSSSSGGQWILNAYLLAVAALLPVLAGVTLPRRVLAAGGALAMAAGAVVCATADSTAVLVAGRAVQGAGAAALLACAAGPLLAGARRDTLAATALPALALALGPLIGGVFAEQNWWRIYLWGGVPLAALAGAAALAAPRPERRAPPGGPERLLAFAAGLTAMTIALVQGEVWPWGWSALLLLAGAAFLRMARLQELPGTALAWATLAGCLTALIFLVPEYFQLARNLSGLRSGTLLLAVTVPAVAAWSISPLFAKRVSPMALELAGVACAGAGLAVLITIDAHTPYAVLIAVLGLAGAGLGLAAGAARDGPPPESRLEPLASALVGAALGLAAAGGSFQFAQADERGSNGSFAQALAAGVGWAALLLLVLLLLLAVWRLRAPARARR